MKNEITNLRKTHSAQPQTNPATENSELAELRFHKEALENKLRKYASHCQNLEDERTGVLHVLRATKIDGINENDLAKTIVTLCDRVSSLEEERDSLSARPSDSAEEIEELKRIKYSLEKDLAVARKEVLKLLSSTSQRDDELARLRQDLDSTRLALEEQAQVSTSSAELELQLKYLEKENLRLMQELKNTKKQLQSARTQAAKINIAESDDTTMDLQALKSRIALEHKPPRSKSHAREDKPPQSKKRALEHTSTPIKGRVVVDKENSGNDVAISAVLPTRPASTAKKARVAGLGESTGETEENTAECTQS